MANLGRKKIQKKSEWKQNINKKLKNQGKAYVSHSSKKEMPKKQWKLANCIAKGCKLNCNQFTDAQVAWNFKNFWSLGSNQAQWCWILDTCDRAV